jgi:hypothetical protein
MKEDITDIKRKALLHIVDLFEEDQASLKDSKSILTLLLEELQELEEYKACDRVKSFLDNLKEPNESSTEL